MIVPARLSTMAKYHLASGVLFAVALSAYILASGYRTSVVDIGSKVAVMGSNAVLMAEDTRRMEERQARVRAALPAGYDKGSQREAMLLFVERLRSSIPGAAVSLDEFSESGPDILLPVAVEFETASFEEAVRAVAATRSSRMPYFEIKNIDARRLDGSFSSARYKIEGVVTMPAAGLEAEPPTKRPI